MIGTVDEAGRALVSVRIRPVVGGDPAEVLVWIDTAVDGELVLPTTEVSRLGLTQSAAVKATLADGSVVVLETYGCLIDWFGVERPIEAIANSGRFPLAGIVLLRAQRLLIDYRTSRVEID